MDGIGAFDHVLRSAMMSKLCTVPELRGLLPFVRSTYAHPTSCRWQDSTHQVHQVEGGEKGDPLMPLLFSPAIHDALVAVKAEFRDGEVLFAFLDDVYVVCGPNHFGRCLTCWRTACGGLWEFGCTRGRHECGTDPVCFLQTWKIWAKPSRHQVLSDVVAERVQEETRLWEAVEWVPDLQAAWQILVQCAGPRCHHLLRTLPPSQSSEYAFLHDAGMLRAMKSLLESHKRKKMLVGWVLGQRPGWLQPPIGPRGLTCTRDFPFWLSQLWSQLEAAAEPVGCLAAGNTLDRHGFVGRPQWAALQEACVHFLSLTLNLVSGPTAGNIMHLPLLNTITGRSLCCVSRALPTRRIFGRTLVLGRPKSWSDGPPSLSSGLHQISSERSSWRDSVCRCSFVKPGASADCRLTVTDGTEQHAPTQAGCALEPQHQNAHSPECAGRPERQFAPPTEHCCSCGRRKSGGGARVRSTTLP